MTVQRWVNVFALLFLAAPLGVLIYFTVLYLRYHPQRKIQSGAQKRGRLTLNLTFFNAEYWNRTNRIAFLTILLVAWPAVGIFVFFGSLYGSAGDVRLGTGHLGGPGPLSTFESLPDTPERNLLLAMAYQYDRQLDKAEALYRQLPQFPESSNNLGALLKDSGRRDEARAAFERALQLQPGMDEALWNLGRPSASMWTELHQRYTPDRAMLVPAHRERIPRAVLGGPVWKKALEAWKGPWLHPSTYTERIRVPDPIVITVLFLALASIVFLPARDVTQPPQKYLAVLDLLIPGTAPEWRRLGGLALVGWIALVLRGSVFSDRIEIIYAYGWPASFRAFGLPYDQAMLDRISKPDLTFAYAALVLLWAVNAALIWYSRRRAGN